MRTVSQTARLVLLLVVAVYFCGVAPFHPVTTTSRASFLQYGQTLALSDLDGDHRIDQARLGGSGENKTVDLFFSRNLSPSVLHFITRSSSHGSLLARDIDNDGDSDLIWTDSVNPDDVVIWVNDGVGRFRQTTATGWAAGFVIGGQDLSSSSGSGHDLSAGLSKAPDFHGVGSSQNWGYGIDSAPKTRYSVALVRPGSSLLPSGRAPPLNS